MAARQHSALVNLFMKLDFPTFGKPHIIGYGCWDQLQANGSCACVLRRGMPNLLFDV